MFGTKVSDTYHFVNCQIINNSTQISHVQFEFWLDVNELHRTPFSEHFYALSTITKINLIEWNEKSFVGHSIHVNKTNGL